MKVKDLREVIDDLVEEYELDVQKTYVYLEVCNGGNSDIIMSFYPLAEFTGVLTKTKSAYYLYDAKIDESNEEHIMFKKTLKDLIEELEYSIDKGHEGYKILINGCTVKPLANNLSCFVTQNLEDENIFVISGYMCNEKCLMEDY